MNIAEAKQEIINTLRAYTAKDEEENYKIPIQYQRPVLLMGPPGIGKTAIMKQIAEEEKIGLVEYTLTHHTRQSAVGLPILEKKRFQGEEYTVTEYTMSEMLASVYECIEKEGKPLSNYRYAKGLLWNVWRNICGVRLKFFQDIPLQR